MFISLLSLMNPVLAISQYLNMTNGMTKEAKRTISLVCGAAIFIIMGIFLFAGGYIMEILGIHEYSLRLGGGIIVLILGIKIILGNSEASSAGDRSIPDQHDKHFDMARIKSLGVSPLALPMVIGPASIVLVIIYGQDAPNLITRIGMLVVIIVLASIITITFLLADYIGKAIGETGIIVITKIMGLILTAIAFEMIIAGLQTVSLIFTTYIHAG